MNVYKVIHDKTINKEILLTLMEISNNTRDLMISIYKDYSETNRLRLNSAMKFYNLEKEFQEFKIKTAVTRGPWTRREQILIKDSEVSKAYLKKYIVRHNILEYKCSLCSLTNLWEGRKLVLQLDHIDGDSKNNDRLNLRYLCPNCHSQTPTYCIGNKKLGQFKKPCSSCETNLIKPSAEICRDCYNEAQGKNKINLLSKEDLQLLINNYPMMDICAVWVCSFDNLNNLINRLGVIKVPNGEWTSKRSKGDPDLEIMKQILAKYNIEGRFNWVRAKPEKLGRYIASVCKHGHEYTSENTLYAGKNKKKVCRICRDLRNAARPKASK